jgi:hypothetical protein
LFKHRLMLSAAATALLAGPALAANPTVITTILTAPLKTSTANSGAPDNVQINSGGGITINATGAALTIDSNNWVNNGGVISNKDHDGARGVTIDATGAGGTLTAPIGNPFLLNTGTIDLTGTGTGKIGVLLNGGTYNGSIDLGTGSILKVQGDSSNAVQLTAGSILNGDLIVGGTVSLSQTTASSLTASNLIGIDLLGTINGNVNIGNTGGSMVVSGSGAQGLVLANGAVINGTLENTGTLATTGIVTVDAKKENPEAGSAMIINGNITGGFYNAGPALAGDGTPAGVISMKGVGPAMLIAPTSAASAGITLGAVPITIDGTNTAGFGFINHGSILGSTVDANVASPVIGLQFGGAVQTTTITGGALNTGNISSSVTSATGGVIPVNSNTAVAIFFGSNATMPVFTNRLVSTGGTIAAAIQGPGGGVSTAIQIAQTANLPELDNLDGATIAASATSSTSAQSNATYQAFAIDDLSGSLKKIENSGTIEAGISTVENGVSAGVAINVAANTSGVTIDNGIGNVGGLIKGSVIFGSGSDTFNIGLGTGSASMQGAVNFGDAAGGVNDVLHIGAHGQMSGGLLSSFGKLDVIVDQGGALNINNTTLPTPVPTLVDSMTINANGSLGITIAQGLNAGVVKGTTIDLIHDANFSVSFGSFINATGDFVLLDTPAGGLAIPDAQKYHDQFTTPFLFTGQICTHNVAGSTVDCGASITSPDSQLILTLTQKSAAAVGLTGNAAQLYPIVNQVLPKDNALGSAIIAGVTDTVTAQSVYDAFAPQVSGGSRAIAVALTDQGSGVVGARQRALRMYGKQPGDSSLWGIEYAEFLKDPGEKLAGGGIKTGFKDHGFGFSIGADGGSADDGWYGGALTFYSGDIGQVGDRHGQAQTEWYMLTGYTDWRGRGLFFDSNLNVGIAQFKDKRIIDIDLGATNFTRTALSKHIGTYLSGGFTTGAMLKYSGTTIAPQLSVDGLLLRENGYTEQGGGSSGSTATDGFDLAVGPSYSNSLRTFLGVDLRQDIDLGDFFLQPEARGGYRYDFLADAQKVTSNFVSLPGTANQFTITGPDPAKGNFVAGASLAASTDTWSLGVSYDWIRGSNGATQQSGQFTLVGRI